MIHAGTLSATAKSARLPQAETANPCVLIIDADTMMATRLRQAIAGNHLQFEQAGAGPDALRRLSAGGVDLVLLELDLPGVNGIDFLRQLRMHTPVPVIVVTARAPKVAAVLCLELGADDYVLKPADGDELNARIRAVLRRGGTSEASWQGPGFAEQARAIDDGIVTFSGWRFDLAGMNLWAPAGALVDLTATEADVLRVLVAQARRPLTRSEINLQVRRDGGPADDRRIDVLIKKIRAKIAIHAPDLRAIKSIRGVGYMFCLEARQAS